MIDSLRVGVVAVAPLATKWLIDWPTCFQTGDHGHPTTPDLNVIASLHIISI